MAVDKARAAVATGGTLVVLATTGLSGFQAYLQHVSDTEAAVRSEVRRDKAAVTREKAAATIDAMRENLLRASIDLAACEASRRDPAP